MFDRARRASCGVWLLQRAANLKTAGRHPFVRAEGQRRDADAAGRRGLMARIVPGAPDLENSCRDAAKHPCHRLAYTLLLSVAHVLSSFRCGDEQERISP